MPARGLTPATALQTGRKLTVAAPAPAKPGDSCDPGGLVRCRQY